jgi:DNA repair exonuclease SbcCD nuclease subunit
MKVLCFSDIHLDAVTAGKPRRVEIVRFLFRARDLALEHKAELVIFSGDAHDAGGLLDPLYSAILIQHLLGFPQTLVAIPGNHDVIDTSELFDDEPITTLTPVRAAARGFNLSGAQSHLEKVRRFVHVLERPRLKTLNADWAVLALPYLSKAHKAASAGWMMSALADAEKHTAAGGKLIVVGHLVIPGAVISSESVEMAKGQDQLFPFEMIESLKPALVINGHYHSRQVVNHGALKIAIPGSPLRFTFGEAAEVHKGVLIVELE